MEGISAADWTMDRVVQWLRARPPFAYLESLFVGNECLYLLYQSISVSQSVGPLSAEKLLA